MEKNTIIAETEQKKLLIVFYQFDIIMLKNKKRCSSDSPTPGLCFRPEFQSCSESIAKGDILMAPGASDGPYAIRWHDYFDSTSQCENNNRFVKEDLIGTTRTIKIDGIAYEGTYVETEDTYVYSSSVSDQYVCKGCGFWLDDKNGKLTRLIKASGYAETPIGEKEGREIAERFLSEFIDISNFRYDGFRSLDSELDGPHRTFVFKRELSGIPTSECARVNVTVAGEICDYLSTALGDFEGYTLPSDFDPGKAMEEAEKRITDVIKGEKDLDIVEYSLKCQDSKLIMFDGRCYYQMYYVVRLDINGRTRPQEDLVALYYVVD